MKPRVALVADPGLPPHGAGSARIDGFERAFRAAGWAVDRPAATAPAEGRPGTVRQAVGNATAGTLARVGLAGEIAPRVAMGMARWLRSSRPDVAVVSAPPFSLLALAASARPPVILDIRDVLALHPRAHLVARMLSPLERGLTRRAAGVAFAGDPSLAEEIAAFSEIPPARIVPVPNGVLAEELPEATAPRSADRPVRLVFCGSLYGGATVGALPEMLAAVGPSVARLTVIGPTPAHARRRFFGGMTDEVDFLPSLPRRDLYRRLAEADLGVLALSDWYPFEFSIPAKAYDYAAMGLPILYFGPAEAAVKEIGAVHRFDLHDADGAAAFLRSWRRRRGRVGAHPLNGSEFSREAAGQPLLRLAEEVRECK